MTQPGDELGAFTQVRMVHHAAVADLFSGLDQAGRPVVMVALTQEAGADPAWRGAFSELVNRDRATVNPADPQFVAAHAGELQGSRPWVASRFEPGRRGVERILNVIPQALPPGVDPTAIVGSALASAGMQAPPPAQPGPFGAPPQSQYAPNGYPGQPQYPGQAQHPGQPGYPGQAEYPGQYAGYPGQPPVQAGPPAAEQYSPPVSSAPFPTPVSSAPQSGIPQSGIPQSGPPSDPYAAPVSGQPPQPSYASGPPAQFASAGYGSPDQGAPAYSDPAVPYGHGGLGGPDNPYDAPPPSGGSNRRGAGLLIGLITAVTALVIVAAGFAVVFINSGDDEKPSKPAAKASPSNSPLPAETAAPSPTPSRSPLPSTTPTIRQDAETVSVIGPTWQNEDKTQLLDFTGWPFAFRMPEGWSCLRGTIDEIPDANAWGCVKTDGASHQQRFNLMLRRCPTGCTAPEQQTMNEAWFDDDEEAILKKSDATTTYAEVAKNDDGFYALSISHFFADEQGGKLTYQVGVWFQSPDKYKEEMQKSLNDVRTQAPQPN